MSRLETLLDDRAADLVLSVQPLLKVLRGDKQQRLRVAWMRAAHGLIMKHARDRSKYDAQSPKAIARQLFTATCDLLASLGWSRAELAELFNDDGEGVRFSPAPDDALAEMIVAALALAAQRQLAAARLEDARASL